jgi:hypothetical protein
MKPQAKKQEIVKKPDVDITTLATSEAPDYLAEYASEQAEGFEEVRPSDVKVPRIAVAQAMTPQLNEDDAKFISTLKRGHFFNTATGEDYGETILFVPLLKFGNRILFEDIDKGGGLLCRSNDMKQGEGDPGGECAKCEYARFGTARGGKGKGTACNEFYNFPVLIVRDGKINADSIAVLSMKSSHIEAAQKLLGLAMNRRLNGSRAPMWSGVYSATSKLKKFTAGSSHVIVIDNAGWISKENTKIAHDSYQFMHELREQGRLTTDQEVDEPGASDESNS